MSSSTHPSVDIKFDFVPFNGTPGETYDKWERALLNAGPPARPRADKGVLLLGRSPDRFC